MKPETGKKAAEYSSEQTTQAARLWDELIDLADQLPDEKRQELLALIRVYIHEVRHTIGLITSSEALLRRDLEGKPGAAEAQVLLDIISIAAKRLTHMLADTAQSLGEGMNNSD